MADRSIKDQGDFKPEAARGEPGPPEKTNLMATIYDLFAHRRQTWASCPDSVQTLILDKICGTICGKMEQEHGVRQDPQEGFTDNWAAVAAELEGQS